MLKLKTKKFKELNVDELYAILQLRSEVFVVEQDCVYQDIDYKDQKSIHILGYKEDSLVAYTRVFNSGDYFDKASIGRVLVKECERKYGYGHELVEYSINAVKTNFKTSSIQISAQLYLKQFYESHNFKSFGDVYLEDGIEHIGMIMDNSNQ